MSKVKKILVLDDDDVLRMVLRKMLGQLGYETVSVYSIEGAVKAAERSRPDLILLDLDLGHENGHDFIEFRGKNLLLKSIPIIVISSSNDTTDIIATKVNGAVDYILKPIELDTLAHKIKKYI